MVERLYYSHPHLECTEVVLTGVSYHKNRLVLTLAKTIFYPEGGGQPADGGSIDGVALIDVQTHEDHIKHFVDPKHAQRFEGLIGQTVLLTLDRTRRADHCVQHTAQHLLSAVLFDRYGAATVSFHLGPESSSIDIEKGQVSPEILPRIEAQLFEAVARNLRIEAKVYAHRDEMAHVQLRKPTDLNRRIRVVTITGLDASACGGTHVAATGQLGLIKLIHLENYKGLYRLYFLAGARALADYQRKQTAVQALKVQLSCHESELVERVQARSRENKSLRGALKRVEQRLADFYADTLAGQSGDVLQARFSQPYETFDLVQKIAALVSRRTEAPILLASESDNKILLCARSTRIHCGQVIKQILQMQEGQGGGNADRAQAVFPSTSALREGYDAIAACCAGPPP